MTWKDMLNRPKYVLIGLGALTALWLSLDEEDVEEFMDGAMIILKKLLVMAIMIWAIKFMISGWRRGGGGKK